MFDPRQRPSTHPPLFLKYLCLYYNTKPKKLSNFRQAPLRCRLGNFQFQNFQFSNNDLIVIARSVIATPSTRGGSNPMLIQIKVGSLASSG